MKIFHIQCPRVNNPSNPKVVAELKRKQKLRRRCGCRACLYLEQHRRTGLPERSKAASMRAKGFVRWSVPEDSSLRVTHIFEKRPVRVLTEKGMWPGRFSRSMGPRIEGFLIDTGQNGSVRCMNRFCNTSRSLNSFSEIFWASGFDHNQSLSVTGLLASGGWSERFRTCRMEYLLPRC